MFLNRSLKIIILTSGGIFSKGGSFGSFFPSTDLTITRLTISALVSEAVSINLSIADSMADSELILVSMVEGAV